MSTRHGRVLLVATAALAVTCERKQVVASFPDRFAGVGLELRIEKGAPVVVRALAGGSAAEAGVAPGDRVLAIDGVTTQGLSLGDVVMRIRGQPGSQLTLETERQGQRTLVVLKRKELVKNATQDYGPAD